VAFARWDPILDFLAIHERLDRFAPGTADWRPSVDLYETPTEYVMTAELPGLTSRDIDIGLDDGRLTVSGARRERQEACGQYQQVERGHGSFRRTFHLPAPIEPDGVTADMRDGVLTIRCPKAASPGTRRVQVS
jgi:HSP20 family protein